MKRFLSLTLCAFLILGFILPAYATGTDETTAATETMETVAPSSTEESSEPSTSEPVVTDETVQVATEKPEEGDNTAPSSEAPGVTTEEVPVCTCPGTEEEKQNPDFAHVEGCPFYVASDFDVFSAKEKLLSCTSIDEVNDFLYSLTDSQVEKLIDIVSEAEIRELAKKFNVDLNQVIITPPTAYTEVGPLKPAVTVRPLFRISRFAALRSGENIEEDDNGLILNKKSEYDSSSNKAKITLEAYTTGTVSVSEKSTPVDVVLVLDESGSMADSIYQFTKVYNLNNNKQYYVKSGDSYIQVSWCSGWFVHNPGWYSGFHFIFHFGNRYEPMTSASDSSEGHVQFYEASSSTTTKQQALISAAKKFANSVHSDAINNNVDHRVSVIGFSNDNGSTVKVGLTSDIRNNISNVTGAIDGLKANGGTYIEDGLSNAESVFENDPETLSSERKRVVIIFTDGIPGSGTWNDTTINGSANPAIKTSYALKNTYGATVYTIGMLDDANPGLEISDESNDTARTNKFLHYLSSNYPNAQSMTNGGSGGNNGYYLSANDTASLNAIFEKIAEEIATPSIPLDSNAIIKDIIAPSFEIPSNAEEISIYTEDYNGSTFDGIRDPATEVTAEIVDDTICVSGFDYNRYFVSATQHDGTYGKKLIIEFSVSPKDGFLGGNNVYTNGENSGLYQNSSSENAVENFDRPQVNVPIGDVSVTAANQHVYLLSDVTGASLKAGTKVIVGGVSLNLDPAATNYGLETWQNEFVNIEVKILDGNRNEITDFNALVNDASYSVSVTVSPKTDGQNASGTPAVAKSGSGDASIYVYKPYIVFKDSSINAGDTPNYATDNFVSVAWKHGDVSAPTTMGTAPALTYTYNPAAAALSAESQVKVSVAMNVTDDNSQGDDVTQYVSFYRNACTAENGCDFQGGAVSATDANRVNFIVHIKTFDLTITKSGTNTIDHDGSTERQSYIFHVTGPNNFSMDIVICGDGSKTIKNLPVGTYTVTENESWSWRYDASAPSYSVTAADIQNGQATVTVVNSRSNPYWLNGGNYAHNVFGN